ncbi:MAG TPA: LuxR C-terminal-related transcriptional regulator [Bryobacteraceae bacterium]|jgi:DNA-binding NarL/FixJ family response regulator|nr:LuxR C-terminal-related transcriptional regulator [Bryobacteraceae bacterium]
MVVTSITRTEQLVRELLKCVSPGTTVGDGSHENGVEEVLFDLEVDGLRYLFIRLPKLGQPQVPLSPREQEIVRLVALGHSNKIIAGVLNISSWTVCTHVRRIFTKLGVASRAAMVAKTSELERMKDRRQIVRKSSLPSELECPPAPRSLVGNSRVVI